MRNFFKSAAAFLALVITAQAVLAQTQAETYYFPDYKNYTAGFSTSTDKTILQGQVFKPVVAGSTYEAYPGVELTLDGGADLTLFAVSDENGLFAFDPVPAGNYTLFAQNAENGTFGSVSVALSKTLTTANTLGENSTTFDTASLKLSFDEELFILEKKRVVALTPQAEQVAVPNYPTHGGGMAGGGMGGGAFGNMGLIAAGLGVAGLATGIAALSDSKDGPVFPHQTTPTWKPR